MSDSEIEGLGEEIRESLVRETYALGVTAPAEVRAAMLSLATDLGAWLPELSDPYVATYVTGIFRYGSRDRGESDQELADGLWSTSSLSRSGDEADARAAAGTVLAIRAAIQTAEAWRERLET